MSPAGNWVQFVGPRGDISTVVHALADTIQFEHEEKAKNDAKVHEWLAYQRQYAHESADRLLEDLTHSSPFGEWDLDNGRRHRLTTLKLSFRRHRVTYNLNTENPRGSDYVRRHYEQAHTLAQQRGIYFLTVEEISWVPPPGLNGLRFQHTVSKLRNLFTSSRFSLL